MSPPHGVLDRIEVGNVALQCQASAGRQPRRDLLRRRRSRRRGESTVCAVSKVEAVELVACHVFNMADRVDHSVSMEMVRTRLDRLREHPAGCCQLCRAASILAPADVYRIAKQ